tara:strand:- start:864 stop:1883 length:1020 start_codon:yes stop_codon:yes gene_type:complete
MAVLQSTNVVGTLTVNGVAVGGGKDFKFCCFTGSTSFTPSQDLVDGNGFLAADIIAGGGGAGAWAEIVNTNAYPAFSALTQYTQQAGVGGFIQNPILPITATTACAVAVGAAGNSGSAFLDRSLVGQPGTFLANQTTASAAGKGGNSCFGAGHIAYGGRGGGSSVMICSTQNGCLSYQCEGEANSELVAYAGQSSGIQRISDTSNVVTNAVPFDVSNDFTSSQPTAMQGGFVNSNGKIGASGFECAIGHLGSNATTGGPRGAGCPGNAANTTNGGVHNYNTSCPGNFCDKRYCSGSLYGSPGPFFSTCFRYADCIACKYMNSGSYGRGAPGIVVIKWQE